MTEPNIYYSIIEGTNKTIDRAREIQGIQTKGYLSLVSTTENLSFGGLQKTVWTLWYVKRGYKRSIWTHSITYKEKRDDWQASMVTELTAFITSLIDQSFLWRRIVYGDDL